MNRQTIEGFLANVERLLTDGRREIGRQANHIQRLKDSGHDITDALDLLRALERSHIKNLEERNRLQQQLISLSH